jgi:hypothetical protein
MHRWKGTVEISTQSYMTGPSLPRMVGKNSEAAHTSTIEEAFMTLVLDISMQL